jgi:hypothetical protein
MKSRMGALVALVGLISAFVLPMGTAHAQVTNIPAVPCTIEQGSGTPPAPTDVTGTFTGTFEVTRFVVRQGQLFAVGTLEGVCTATTAGGTTITQTVDEVVRIPINLAQSSGTCEILDLQLGPLHLDLLGLIIDLSQVDLEITAQPGEGNLLGNLLCAVAGLLDNPAATPNALAALLNRILAILG